MNAALMLICISLIATFLSAARAARTQCGFGRERARARRFAGDARIGCGTALCATFFPLAGRPRYPVILLDREWFAPGLQTNRKIKEGIT